MHFYLPPLPTPSSSCTVKPNPRRPSTSAATSDKMDTTYAALWAPKPEMDVPKRQEWEEMGEGSKVRRKTSSSSRSAAVPGSPPPRAGREGGGREERGRENGFRSRREDREDQESLRHRPERERGHERPPRSSHTSRSSRPPPPLSPPRTTPEPSPASRTSCSTATFLPSSPTPPPRFLLHSLPVFSFHRPRPRRLRPPKRPRRRPPRLPDTRRVRPPRRRNQTKAVQGSQQGSR